MDKRNLSKSRLIKYSLIFCAGTVLTGCSHSQVRTASSDSKLANPLISFEIQSISFARGTIREVGKISGSCSENSTIKISLPKQSQFIIDNNSENKIVNEYEIKCRQGLFETSFDGTLTVPTGRCKTSSAELYCLNNSAPNPETESERSYYQLKFNLPEGYTALAPDSNLALNHGVQFQIAKLGTVLRKNVNGNHFDYSFPVDFTPKSSYLDFIEQTMQDYHNIFGSLAFSNIKVGAISRGGNSEASGSPAGNLILFSRTALGDQIKQENLKSIGITLDISDALRKLVIAHELSHFWFGDKYTGQDGWMIEGIPQYLGLVYARNSNKQQGEELLKLFYAMDQRGQQNQISNKPFGDGDNMIKAYYQGPLALYKIGQEVGHKEMIQLLATVFSKNLNPDFSTVEKSFLEQFPTKTALWSESWRIGK